MNNKLEIFSWGLYDSANSIIVANLTLYFSLWLVIDNKLPDIWYSLIIAVSTTILLITAPVVGSFVDNSGWKMRFITPITIITSIFTIAIGLIGAGNANHLIKLVLPSILVIAIYYLNQLSLIPYDTLLSQISSAKNRGRISGFGKGMDDLGFIIGMAITLPFVNQKLTLWGTPGRIQAFVPAGILFLILSLPMLLVFKDKPVTQKTSFSFRDTLSSFKLLLQNKNLVLFLLFFYFFADALLTAQSFFPIYFDQVYGLNDNLKVLLSAVFLTSSVIGALCIGKVSDLFSKKKALSTCSTALCLGFALIPLSVNPHLVWFTYPLLGIFWGGFYAISRAMLINISSLTKLGESFSLFTIFRRFASVIGPLMWGVSVALFTHLGPANKYRVSIYPLVLMMIIGLFLLNKVKEEYSTND